MKKLVVVLCIIANVSWASIGEVIEATGVGQIKREDARLEGTVGTSLEMQDTITTRDASLRLQFEDDTLVDVTEQSRMVIDEFVYDPGNPSNNGLSMRATLGAVRYASGQIAKTNRQRVNIRTPSAKITVRGTDFMMIVDEIGGSMVTLLPSCQVDTITQSSECEVGEISVESDAGVVIMNQAFQTTVVKSRWSAPARPVILDLPENMLRGMLIVRRKSPYEEELEKEYPPVDLLNIDFLAFDELNSDPLVEGIKGMWITDLDKVNYLDEVWADEMERQMQQILAQWLDELSAQNAAIFQQRIKGIDPDTGIFYDETTSSYIVSRTQGDDQFFRLDLEYGGGYKIDMVQQGFSAYGYRLGTGGSSDIYIDQR